MSVRLTASKLPLADHCLAWRHLPALDHGAEDARAVGNAFDDLVAGRIARGSPSFRHDFSESAREQAWILYASWCERFESLIDGSWVAQPAYCAEFDPARSLVRMLLLGTEVGRAYPPPAPHSICGTADIVIAHPDHPIIRDTKTGRQAATKSRGVRDNRQLRFLAWAVATLGGHEHATIALDYVSTAGVVSDEAELSPVELREIGGELATIVEDAADPSRSIPQPGLHCTEQFCPAFASCPAVRALAESVSPDAVRRLPILAEPSALTEPERARAVYEGLRAIDGLSARWWKLLDAYVDQYGSIPLDGGASYARTESERESLEYGPGAMAVLVAHLGGERARSVVRETLTKSAISEAARGAAGAGRGGAALERTILSGLREAGVMRTSVAIKHEVVRARRTTR